MVDTEKLLENTKKTIRSLLLSVKEGLNSFMLEKDHRELMGSSIPFKQLGFSSLDDLLSRIPDVCRKAYDKTGAQVYKAVADESTAHIAELVAHQKSKKPKSRKTAKFSSYTHRKPKNNYSFRPSHKYVPSSYSTYKGYHKYNTRSKPTSYSQPQVSYTSHPVHNSQQWPARKPQGKKEKPVVIPKVTVHRDSNRKQSEAEVRDGIKQLLKIYPSGIWLHLLSDMYLGVVGANLPPEYLDYIVGWTDLVAPDHLHGKILLYPAPQKSVSLSASIAKPLEFPGEIQSPNIFYVGEEADVCISYVDPKMKTIYVHRTDSRINEIMTQLNECYANTKNRASKNIVKNCVCATKDLAYDAWNRAVVTDTDFSSMAKVFFMDFGNFENKPLETLHPLHTSLTKEPAQAIPITLYNVTSKKFNLLAQEFSSLTKNTTLTLVCQSCIGGICAVILYDSNTKVCINQKLVSLGLAEWEDSDESIDYTKSKSPVKPAPPVQATSTPNAASTTQAYKPSTKSSPSPVSFNQHNQSSNSKLNGSHTSTCESQPGEHEIPEDPFWSVLVTHVLSSSLVFLRINRETPDFTQFSAEASSVYGGKKPISLLDIGNLYISYTVDEDGEAWHRVRTKEMVDKDTVECEFIDYGSISNVQRVHLYDITNEHRSIPYQTRLCSLYGLELIEDDTDGEMIDTLEEMTSTKTLIAQLISVEKDIPHVVLFDTTGEDDIEINKEIGKLVTHYKLKPMLPEPQQSIDALLTYVERDGTFYVQKVGPAYAILQELMSDINEYYSKQMTTAQDFISQPQVGESVCAKYDGLWYRATIQEVISDKKKFVVFFKDYGNKSTVSSSQLRRIPADVEHAHTLPMQAVPCLLHELSGWNDDVGVEAAQLINSEHPYILTTIESATEDRPALVQLTQKNLNVNTHLLSIYESSKQSNADTGTSDVTDTETFASSVSASNTDNLEVETPSDTLPELPGTPSDTPPGTPPDSPTSDCVSVSAQGDTAAVGGADIAAMHDLSQAGAGDYVVQQLQSLKIQNVNQCQTGFVRPPEVNEFWDVFVTTTNEPNHFVVIPLSEIDDLNQLIENLHQNFKDSKPVEGFEPQSGDLCAGLSCADGFWYRVMVLDGRIDDKLKVLFVDYGNYDFIDVTHLRPLSEEYTQLKLQAVRAGLYNLEPAVGNIWTKEAKKYFIDLCNEKKLVAKIREVDRDKNLLSAGPSVWFELYDTTYSVDISIDLELINKGHAKYSNPDLSY